ncbi:MAG TPA: hypothetical protein V6D06_18780 [Trichocoleus sp.]
MSSKKIALKPKHLALGGIFLTLALGPRVLNYVRTQVEAEVTAAQQNAATLVADGEPVPKPSQLGSGRIRESVLTRATYLLKKGRESGDVEKFITERYKAVNDQLWELNQQLGVFDGQAEGFAQLTNLSAEQQAIELVQFWLQFPEYVHTASGMSVNVQPAGTSQEPEVDYANVTP